MGMEPGAADTLQALTEGRGQREEVCDGGCSVLVHQMLCEWVPTKQAGRERETVGQWGRGEVRDGTSTTCRRHQDFGCNHASE